MPGHQSALLDSDEQCWILCLIAYSYLTSMKNHIAIILCSMLAGVTTASAADVPDIAEVLSQISPKISTEPISKDARWKKPTKVYALVPSFYKLSGVGDFDQWMAEDLDAEIVFIESPAQLEGHEHEVEALMGFCRFFNGEYPNLKWIQNLSAGVEDCVSNDQFNNQRVIVANGAATSGPAIAEWVIASMFMMQRNFVDYSRAQSENKWLGYPPPIPKGTEINGKTILIVGLGGIGKQIAWRAKGLGMKVLATRNSSREGPDYVDYVGLSDELLNLAKQADVVVNAAPLTKKTRGIFNQQFFSAMPTHGLFINVGRGGSVQQDHLITALKTGLIRAAALDVATPEPLPADSELWNLANVFITPHHSSFTEETAARRWVFMKENLRRLVAGEKVYNLVDLQRGY